MCTAIRMVSGDAYFGRNLDLEYSLGESVCIMPRQYPLKFRHLPALKSHYAMIGAALVKDDYPLYYDAVNEHSLAIASLNFPGNAVYYPPEDGKTNVTPFELIPWLLAQCRSVDDARPLLSNLRLTHEPFRKNMPLSPLHWMVSDKHCSIVIEQMADDLHVHENPLHVLTNNPPFPWHLLYLANYQSLTCHVPHNAFAPELPLETYSRGMGGIGLPGDCSSASRFVRAAFALHHSICENTEESRVNQFFHLLDHVAFPRGSVVLENGLPEITVYSSCCNLDRGIYYYTSYENSAITAVDMHSAPLDADTLISYPMMTTPRIHRQN